MAPQLNIKKQLSASGEDLYINRWWTGLVTQRSPLFVPVSSLGLQVISRHDSLLDGRNLEISPNSTVVRRAGHSRYCSVALGAEKPLAFFSYKNTAGVVKAMVDTALRVASFDGASITTVYSKGDAAKTSFTKVGDAVYMCNGTDAKRWDGTNLTKWGIDYPATAPSIAIIAGSLSPLSGYKYVYCYRRSATGEVSSASPASANTLAQTNKNFTLGGDCSTDPTVDKVDIFRTDDGGANYFLLATVNNTGATWSYTDSTPDTGLNDDIVAPSAGVNDPPPTGVSISCFWMGRMWVAAKNKLNFGSGPQVTYGVPESCFSPSNQFTLPGNITALLTTSVGLCVFTSNDFYIVTGTDLSSFTIRKYQANFGVSSQNSVVQDGDLLFVFTTNKQLFKFSDSLEEVGYNVRNLLATLDPSSVCMALHRSGTDEGLFISDGSTSVYRFSIAQNCWCPRADIVGGVGCVASVEVATADYRLMIGRASNAGYLLARDLDATDDDGSAFPADTTVGVLMLAPPGQVANVEAVMLEMMPVGTYPTVSVLLNEISGTFVTLPNPVQDPPGLPASTTVLAKRHYLAAAQTPLPRQMRYLLVKITFATENAKNELLGLSVHGS